MELQSCNVFKQSGGKDVLGKLHRGNGAEHGADLDSAKNRLSGKALNSMAMLF
jgi:hypothetical protein